MRVDGEEFGVARIDAKVRSSGHRAKYTARTRRGPLPGRVA
jgi:hypothetical protein